MAICTGWRVYGEMMPQPMMMRLVCVAITAVIAVEERASIAVLAPPGIGFGKPEDVEAGALAGLRHAHRLRSGSMLSCRTPMRKGIRYAFVSFRFVSGSSTAGSCTVSELAWTEALFDY